MEVNYHFIIDNSPSAFFKIDLDSKLTMINPPFLELWGGESQDEILGKNIGSFLRNSEDQQGYIAFLKREGQMQNYECAILRKDGSSTQPLLNASWSWDSQGNVKGIEGLVYDISA